MAFVRVADESELTVDSRKIVIVSGQEYALFNVSGTVYCIDNACPHAGGPLGEGHVDSGAVSCPWHCWYFDIKTGEGLYGLGIGVGSYPCKVEDGAILIDI